MAATAAAPAKKKARDVFAKDENVLGFHGPTIYDAKILEVDNTEGPDPEKIKYYVHYLKWAKRWDEWVTVERLLKDTPENRKYQEELKASTKKGAAGAEAKVGSKRKSGDEKAGKKSKKRKGQDDDDTVEQDEGMDKKEVKIKITGPLKRQLITDWENVTRHNKLVPLPRDPTVSKILDEFLKSKKAKNLVQENLMKEITDGIKQYFERSLGKLLLYRFERLQFKNLNEMPETKGKNVCDLYGGEHLLRLFVKLPGLLAHTQMSAQETTVLANKLHEFLKFLDKKKSQYILSDYTAADHSYIAKSGATAAAVDSAAAAAAPPAPSSATTEAPASEAASASASGSK